MAEETAPELAEVNSAAQEMELEPVGPDQDPRDDDKNGVESAATNSDVPGSKRAREEGSEEEVDNVVLEKKKRVEKSVEEERLEKQGEEGEEEEKAPVRVSLGPKIFESSLEMFDYFYKFLHYWPPNLNINKYEHLVLIDLLKKGHPEPGTKIGGGINAFQVRYHPLWKSRCFFFVREDESVDDFSFRKCVDNILPLPEEMKIKPSVDKALSGRGGKGRGGHGGRGGGRGRGRGRGGKSRN
ncbi:protein EMBRYO DEFECTIVE 514 [Juglans regia]|uniref:Protein EMBRYO DEFECTIVE 514 n=2 Tax=Juglans regia TaxID=51240 RepID=A0A2I4F4M4_JUGRE|nr:protein EMBRYO DEFECTIVE 514 [Juglans regia]